ncbi:MAG: translation initiation factor IF-2, partial [Chloroflexota bacterium]
MRRPTSRTRRKKNTETRAAPRRVEPSRPAATPQVELEEASMSVKQLADKLHVEPARAVKQFMRRGMMVNLNDVVDFETAARTAQDLGFQVLVRKQQAAGVRKTSKRETALEPRPPVVTIMGHVDHGKTTLLDTIRKENVTAGEAGAITQHIGAYQNVVDGRPITFLDTPGHHAFTEMRARGAHATDIVVLVVAADDGVMPQTREAIDHAKAAGVPIVVAINKVDKPDANIDKTKQQLADAGLLIEEWGGDTIAIPISAKTGDGVPDLLENLFLVAEIAEFTADPTGNAEGVVIEAKLDKARGSLATLLVQQGTLRPGDVVLAGSAWGRIKAMFNALGERVESAGPSAPVEVLGLT